jgi:hypothetical protein
MIGRKAEQDILMNCLQSNRSEFVAVYGRRRVGKTYLIKEYFNNSFSFYATGLSNEKTKNQLKAFSGSLLEHGLEVKNIPSDWYEAFMHLKKLLQNPKVRRDPTSGKKVVFLDEIPWMDTARSDFKSALEYFWNSWGSTQNDLVLIVCGSATSWIIENLLGDKGGFYNRITRQIHLMPFSLGECEELYKSNNIIMTRSQMIESYMIFGGIPYYLNCFDRRLSLAQNVEELLFKESGQLYYEYDRLLSSLFKKHERHAAIIDSISHNKGGMLRVELAKIPSIGDGEPLTKALNELEQCGFIRKYKNYAKEKQGFYFQIIDPFMYFCFHFIKKREHESWLSYINTPGYFSWSGNAFELVCLLHVNQIKNALGISGVETSLYAWHSNESKPGAQIDLLIDRADGMINICEAKYTTTPFVIDASYSTILQNKINSFIAENSANKTIHNKALHLTFISANGLVHNQYSSIVQNELTGDDLFVIS